MRAALTVVTSALSALVVCSGAAEKKAQPDGGTPDGSSPDAIACRPSRVPPLPGSGLAAGPALCTGAGWCWENYPEGDAITSVAGSSGTDLWAGGASGGLAHFDGSRWTGVCDPSPSRVAALWSNGSADAWAVSPLGALRWDGSGWKSAGAPAVERSLEAIWASGPGDVWLVGPLDVLHFDGTQFTRYGQGDLGHLLGYDFGLFRDVWGTGPSDVWLAAEHGVLHYDGRSFAASLTAPEELASIWASGPSDGWVVGVKLDGGAAAYHWAGHGWLPSALLADEPQASRVRGSGPADVWFQAGSHLRHLTASGLDTVAAPSGAGPFFASAAGLLLPDEAGVSRYDGHGFVRELRTRGPWLDALSGSGPPDVWAVGREGATRHFDGASWTDVTPAPSVAYLSAASAPAAGDLWAAGVAAPGPGGTAGLVLHRVAAGWSAAPSPALIQAVFALSPSDVWAAGDSGTLLHFAGSGWAPIAGAEGKITAVWGAASNDLWVASLGAPPPGQTAFSSRLYHWNGTAVAPADAIDGALTGLWGTGASDVWGFGSASACTGCPDDGALVHYDGRAWQRLSPLPFLSLTATRSGEAWAVVDAGPLATQQPGLYRWDGSAWKRASAFPALAPESIWEGSDGVVWGVRGSAILRFGP